MAKQLAIQPLSSIGGLRLTIFAQKSTEHDVYSALIQHRRIATFNELYHGRDFPFGYSALIQHRRIATATLQWRTLPDGSIQPLSSIGGLRPGRRGRPPYRVRCYSALIQHRRIATPKETCQRYETYLYSALIQHRRIATAGKALAGRPLVNYSALIQHRRIATGNQRFGGLVRAHGYSALIQHRRIATYLDVLLRKKAAHLFSPYPA